MDNTAQLDPKLREVYERVLGGKSPQITSTPASSSAPDILEKEQTPLPSPQDIVDSALGQVPSASSGQAPSASPTTVSKKPTLMVEEVNDMHKMPPAELSPAPSAMAATESSDRRSEQTTKTAIPESTAEISMDTHDENIVHGYIAPRPRSATSIAVYIILGLIFLAIYSVVWIKVFGLNLPFIGQ